MERREQLRIYRRTGKASLYRRGRARRLPGGDTDDQDSEITRKNGDFGIAIETGKTQVQRDTRTTSGKPGVARGGEGTVKLRERVRELVAFFQSLVAFFTQFGLIDVNDCIFLQPDAVALI